LAQNPLSKKFLLSWEIQSTVSRAHGAMAYAIEQVTVSG
jgi:hypothetical protein